MKLKTIALIGVLASIALAGCSGKEDVGDANKDPAKGSVKPMGAPAGAAGGATMAPPATPK